MIIRLRQSIIAILLLAGTLTARTSLADAAFGYAGHPYPGFSIQIYSASPGYYYPHRHHRHRHHHHHYPRFWHAPAHHFYWHGYHAPPRYSYSYYPPGLNMNWRRFRCD